jgi:H+/Cl- antiporter ClcA
MPARMRPLPRRLALGALVGVACGLGSALFLALLDLATGTREAHPALVWALPLAGVALGLLIDRWGRPVAPGTSLVLDAFHEDRPQLPLRMGPIVLLGTVWTHLFGGSAGREGTAVQVGASLADAISHGLRVSPDTRRELLCAGIAGGFGSVFGTPFAGALFGLEVMTIGRVDLRALVPALSASVVGDLVTRGLGVTHTPYPQVAPLTLSAPVLAKWVLFAAAVALVSVAFVEGAHALKRQLGARVASIPLRLMLGGLAVLALRRLAGTDDYLGLGVPTILRAFTDPSLAPAAFAWKLLFTLATVGAGFLGGEVTPLFFVGAALGNALGQLLGLPLDLAAAVGLAATFGACANTPLALALMAVELVGAAALPHVLVVSLLAYLLTGHRGLYPAQRLHRRKWGAPLPRPVALRDLAR